MNGMISANQTVTLARISQVTVTDDMLSVDLEDGRTIAVPIGWYPRLAYGTTDERANFQISGAGYGIHRVTHAYPAAIFRSAPPSFSTSGTVL